MLSEMLILDSDREEALMEVEVSIKDGFAQSFRIISDRIHIVDIPGIEDGAHSIPIKAYIE